jgi:hypothetical protein
MPTTKTTTKTKSKTKTKSISKSETTDTGNMAVLPPANSHIFFKK